METFKLTIIRLVLGFIPGIGGLFWIAIMFDVLPVKYWNWGSVTLSIIHMAYLILFLDNFNK